MLGRPSAAVLQLQRFLAEPCAWRAFRRPMLLGLAHIFTVCMHAGPSSSTTSSTRITTGAQPAALAVTRDHAGRNKVLTRPHQRRHHRGGHLTACMAARQGPCGRQRGAQAALRRHGGGPRGGPHAHPRDRRRARRRRDLAPGLAGDARHGRARSAALCFVVYETVSHHLHPVPAELSRVGTGLVHRTLHLHRLCLWNG